MGRSREGIGHPWVSGFCALSCWSYRSCWNAESRPLRSITATRPAPRLPIRSSAAIRAPIRRVIIRANWSSPRSRASVCAACSAGRNRRSCPAAGHRPRRVPPRAPVVVRREKPKADPTTQVIVFGDALAEFAGQGIGELFADSEDVVVIRKAKENAGLTSMSAAEWAKTVDDAVGTDKKMTVAVVMLGTQDRQPLKQEGAAARAAIGYVARRVSRTGRCRHESLQRPASSGGLDRLAAGPQRQDV